MTRIKFMNTEIDNLILDEVMLKIDELIKENLNSYVVTPNIDHIVKLETDKELQNVYNHADLILADGEPLIWLSKLYKNPIKEKISGSDLFPLLCERAAEKNYNMFFLGGKEGVAKRAAENLKKRFKNLNVSGTYSPPFGFENDKKEIKKIINMIHKHSPHILIVCLGCPKQEKFMYNYREKLNVPISLGLGASIDFEAGTAKRAPKWMSKCGLEWFYRLCSDPKRLFKRYLIDDLKIFKLFFKYLNN